MKTIPEQLPELRHTKIDNETTTIFFIVKDVKFSLYTRSVTIVCEQYTQFKNAQGVVYDSSKTDRVFEVNNNTYAVPRVNAQGQPVMTETQVPTGQLDANGFPIMETVQVPAAMGNYDFIYRMLQQFGFDQMLLGAVVSRVGNTENPLVWVQQEG